MKSRRVHSRRQARVSATTKIMIGLVVGLLIGYVISITDPKTAEIIRPFSHADERGFYGRWVAATRWRKPVASA